MTVVAKARDLIADTHDNLRIDSHAKEENLLLFKYLWKTGYTDAQVIEVGCGTGLLIDYLDEKIEPGKYLGLDVSKEMVAVARAKHPEYAFSDTSILHIPTLEDMVEALVCTFGIFSYLMTPTEIEGVLAEMLRVLKPGGKLFLMVHGAETFRTKAYELSVAGQVMPRRPWTAAGLREYVEKGFDVVKVWGMASRWFYRLPSWTPRFLLRWWLWVEVRTTGRWRPARGRFLMIEAVKPIPEEPPFHPVQLVPSTELE